MAIKYKTTSLRQAHTAMSHYKSSFYLDTKTEMLTPDSYDKARTSDICIVGGGVAAISCAQRLLASGHSVTLFEAGNVFSGASGLNGGMVSPGYALGLRAIRRKVGLKKAQKLFALTVDGVQTISDNIDKYEISSAQKTPGKVELLRHAPSTQELQFAKQLHEQFNYEVFDVDKAWIRQTLSATVYKHGFLYKNGFHIQPLNYGVAVTKALQNEGLKVVEGETVFSIRVAGDAYEVTSTSGTSSFNQVVVCTGGYASNEPKKVRRSVLPITTYVAVTEPDDEIPQSHIKSSYGFGDTRKASDYYRVVNGNQLLWGGRITAFPDCDIEQITAHIKNDIHKSYPTMSSPRITTAWSGIMGYASHQMPCIGQLNNGIWYCSAFGGRGLGAGTAGGQVAADAITGRSNDISLFKAFGLRSTYGILGRIAVEATYKKYILMDKIKETGHRR